MFLIYPEWRKKILQTKMSQHASSCCLQEVKNNGSYKTVCPKSGHGSLRRDGHLRVFNIILRGFDWENVGVFGRMLLIGGSHL